MSILVCAAGLNDGDVERIAAQARPRRRTWMADARSLPPSEAADVEVLLAYGDVFGELALDRLPRLRWIQLLSSGTELVPRATVRERGIVVTTIRGVNASAVAEHALGAILSFERRLGHFAQLQRERTWEPWVEVGELRGKTLGVFGTGAVGTAIAVRAKAFEMRVVGLRRRGAAAPAFDALAGDPVELCVQADHVVMALPLTAQTVGILGHEALAAMRPSAHVVNVARGPVIDEAALVAALRERRIAGASLDVFANEPLPANHPFWSLDGVAVTPHASGRSPTLTQRSLELFLDNLSRYDGGRPLLNVVDLRAGY